MSTAERDIDNLITPATQAHAAPARVTVDIEESAELGKFFEALADAQGEMENALKDSKNPHFNSSFADLASVVEAIKGPLAKYKLARVQQVLTRANCTEVGVRTKLGHSSGQWMAATVWTKAERPGPQALGSATTYLRRYSLAAVAGVAPADDDGEAAEGRGNGPQRGQAGNGPKAAGGGASPKGQTPPPSPISVVPAEPGESGPASSTETPPASEDNEPVDLVACWRKVEEGHRKNNTYRYEFVPMEPQERRTANQNARIHVLKGQRGLEDDEWSKALLETFNKDTSKDLSREEADRLIETLESAIKRWGNKRDTAAAKAARQADKATRVDPDMAALMNEEVPPQAS